MAGSWAVSSAVRWDGRSASTWATGLGPESPTAWKSVYLLGGLDNSIVQRRYSKCLEKKGKYYNRAIHYLTVVALTQWARYARRQR